MTYDIRAKDKVKLKILKEEDFTKFLKFAKRNIVGEDGKWFNNELGIACKGVEFLVRSVKKSKKTNTEFAVLSILNGQYKNVELKCQARYLSLVSRVAAHPVTSIFL